MKTKKTHNGNKAKTASLAVLLFSVFLLSALAGVQFVGEVSAAGPYDWPMFRHDLQHTGYSASPAPNTNQTLWNYTTGGEVISSPAVADGKVYIGSNDNSFYCLNATTGAKIWNYTTGSDVYSCPAVADGKVYVGSADKEVYCFDAATGAKIWNYTTGNQVISSPAVADGKVYIGSSDNKLYCLNALTGALLWNYTTGGALYGTSPAVVASRIYVGSRDDNVYCLDAATGAKIWNYTTGNDVVATVAVVNGSVFVGSSDDNVYCLDAVTGAKIWNYTTRGDAKNVAVAYGKVYVGSSDFDLYCLDAGTGARVWNYTTGGQVVSPPAVADDKVFVGSWDRKVYCLNAATGAFIWSYSTSYQSYGSGPAVANAVVYIGSGDGNVYAFSSSPPVSAPAWSKTYGGAADDKGWGDLVQTSDGGYAISGDTSSFGTGGSADYWLIRVDSAGNMLWNKTYGGSLSESENAMIQTREGGYALAGYTASFGAGGQDFWLVKTDALGNMLWNKTYGGTGSDMCVTVFQTSDGGYAIAGLTSSFGAGGQDVWLVKTDAAGNMLWNKTYGGAGADLGFSVVQTIDGGYAVSGPTNSFGAGGNDIWLVKTDAAGNMQWNKTYGGPLAEWMDQMILTGDGGYAIAGYTASFGAGSQDVWLVKTDAAGNMQWNRTYGGAGIDNGFHLTQTVDGGYAIIGSTNSFGAGGQDFWLVRTDSAGSMLWNKTYGGAGGDFGYSIGQTSDGGYALAGYTSSFGAGGNDFYLVKVDEFGVIPEFPSWLLLSLALAATGFIAIGKKRLPRSR